MPELRIGFAGSPAFAATILDYLAASSHRPCVVFTQPDRPRGRGKKVQANAVKTLANELEIPVHQPATLKTQTARDQLASYQLDALIVAAYGLILPQAVLDLPRYGCINVHASLLPRWRGAAPIERAIMAGDDQTGVCLMQMEAGLDTGPVFSCQELPITEPVDVATLEQDLAITGSRLLVTLLDDLASQGKLPVPQAQDDHLATYAEKLSAADRSIDWHKPAEQIARQISALAARLPVRVELNTTGVQFIAASVREQTIGADDAPPPGTIVDTSKQGITVQCATNLLQITSLKVEKGKGKVLDAAAVINGYGDLFFSGARFS